MKIYDFRFKNGITLISLIITIIVLLLLAGVSLNAVIGDNGIVTRARDAKINTEEAELKEQIEMVIADALSVKMASPQITQNEIRDYIKNQFQEKELKATIENDENWYVIVYGIYKKNIWYLTEELQDIKEDLAVIGSVEDWTYEVDPETQKALLTGYNYEHLGSTIVIPNVIDGYLISGLGNQVFMLRTGLKEVTFSEGLRTIGDKAFSGCSNLTKINDFPSTLRSIGSEAFYGCSNLELNLTFNDYLKTIGDRAFYSCSKITGTVSDLLRKSVRYGQNVFSGCSKITGDIGEAMSVLISDTDTEIPANLFSGMSGLTGTIAIGLNIEKIGENAFYNCNRINKIDFSNATNLKIIEQSAFHSCIDAVGEIDIINVEEIGNTCFQNCQKITKVVLPSSLKSVGFNTFIGMKSLNTVLINCGDVFESTGQNFSGNEKLENVLFGEECTMTKIPRAIFQSCTGLKEITMPDNITIVDEYAFFGCTELKNVKYSSDLRRISRFAFYNCKNLITLPLLNEKIISSITTIGNDAFNNCINIGYKEENAKVDFVNLLENSNIVTLGSSSFYGCKYLCGTYDGNIYNLSNNGIVLGSNVFFDTGIVLGKEFIISNSNKIMDSEFKSTTLFYKVVNGEKIGLTEIKIPEGVTEIGNNAFEGCSSITKIILPTTITKIGSNAFNNCTSLSIIDNKSNILKSVGDSAFMNCSSLLSFNGGNLLETVGSKCFFYCKSLNSFNFNNGLKTIGNTAFEGTIIKTVILPSTVTSLSNAFYSCKELETFDCSKTSITSLGSSIFWGCLKLKNVTLNEGIETINNEAFNWCSSLETITIPNSVTTLGNNIFYGCSNITKIYGGLNIFSFGYGIFRGCSKLDYVEILKNITTINKQMFDGCSNLELSNIVGINWNNITMIDDSAFCGCSKMVGVINLPVNCVVASNAFTNCPLQVNIGY